MKKFLALILTLCMCFSLVACGGTESPANPDTSIDPSMEETDVETVVFSPITLVDNDKFIFRVESAPYVHELWNGYSFDVYVENKTDQTVYIATNETSVNDFMIDPYFTVEVAAGKKMVTSMDFMKEDLDKTDITSFDKVSFRVGLYDEHWESIYETGELSVTFTKE